MSIMQEICPQEVHFSPASFCSSDGRLFHWNNQLYRAISYDRTPFFENLWKNGVIDKLVQNGLLVESKPVDLHFDGYGMVIKHRELPLITYPFEWCDQAFFDAALYILSLNLNLLEHGLMTHDVHPWNIMFEKTKPLLVDLGSIQTYHKINFEKWVENFHRFYLRPLHLFAQGQSRIARLCLQDWRDWQGGVSEYEYVRLTEKDIDQRFIASKRRRLMHLMPDYIKTPTRSILHIIRKYREKREINRIPKDDIISRQNAINSLISCVDSIEFQRTLHWDYYKDLFSFPSFDDPSIWSRKNRYVEKIVKMTNPQLVLDIGSNRGWYSLLAAKQGADVVAFEIDELLTSYLYLDAKDQDLSVHPLVINFLWPSPSIGLLEYWPSAKERFQSDMVIALALIHHLVHREGMQFDHIIEGFSLFNNSWLLTEFIEMGDEHLSKWAHHEYDWYTLDNFLTSLEKRYEVIQMKKSDPKTRSLIFCKKRI